MSYVVNYGTIHLGKDLTERAIDEFKETLKKHDKDPEWYEDFIRCMIKDEPDIVLDDYYDKDFDETCTYLVEALKPLEYVINAEIKYYGDWEGFTFIEDNEISECDILDAWEHYATDENLIEVLEKRGYKITK